MGSDNLRNGPSLGFGEQVLKVRNRHGQVMAGAA
jgi:hypothetical protein